MLTAEDVRRLDVVGGEQFSVPRRRWFSPMVLIGILVAAVVVAAIARRLPDLVRHEPRMVAVPACVPSGLTLVQNELDTYPGSRVGGTTGDPNPPWRIGYNDGQAGFGVSSAPPVVGDYGTGFEVAPDSVTLRSGVVAAAWLSPPTSPNSTGLVWSDPRGLIISVGGANLDPATVIDIANTIRVITEQQWRDELETAPNGQLPICS